MPATAPHRRRARALGLSSHPRYQIGLTDLTLSCAARARVPKPERCGGCRQRTDVERVANCNRRDAVTLATKQGSSAAGPKPGRTSFSVKLGAGFLER